MTSSPQLEHHDLRAVLRARLNNSPEGLATVLVHQDAPDESYSIADVLRRADAFARQYKELASGPNDPNVILVCLYHGLDLHAAFLGGILSGHIPSMIAPPSPRMERDKYMSSFMAMLSHVKPACVVTDITVVRALDEYRPGALSEHHIIDAGTVADTVLADSLPDIDDQPLDPETTAILQHSSGTTGLQKGIALSHRVILEQVRSYGSAIQLSSQDSIATWLPLYHDMGLIACFVTPILSGIPILQISPFDWVAKPVLLLETIKRHRASLCWLPNFAYTFMARSVRASQTSDLDLSSIRAFVNCSEPVTASSHDTFLQRFGEYGARRDQFTACYAMAENVYAITQSPVGEEPRRDSISRRIFESEHRAAPAQGPDSMDLVSNGPVIGGVELKITDEDGRSVEERQAGSILIRGASLFSGYFERADLTRESLVDGWYDTGDLGYVAEGELYVTGRKKDLIIIQGRNFYPTDIEAAVGELDDVIEGRVAAFGESDTASGTESLVVLAESALVRDTPCATDDELISKLKAAIRKTVAQTFDCTVGQVHVVAPRWLVKSTAGKVARADNRAKYERELI